MSNVTPLHERAQEAGPANVEVEMALLAAMLHDNRAYRRVEAFLRPEHFSDPVHGRIYETCARLISEGGRANPITVKDYLSDVPPKFLAELAGTSLGGQGARDYGRTVLDRWKRRQAVELARSIDEDARALHLDRSAEQSLIEARARIDELLADGDTEGSVAFSEALRSAIEESERAYKHGAPGKACGIRSIDNAAGGAVNKRLRIWAARPSMGKAGTLDAKVLLRDGTWKRNGDLALGDELASVDGAPSRVSGIFPQGERQVYRVTLGDGRSTRVSGDHLWAIESSKFAGRRVVTTERLREMLSRTRYHRRIALPLVSGHFGEDRDLPIDPWLLGALIANGCLTGHQAMFSTADAATLFRVQQVVGGDRVVAHGTSGYDYRINRADGPCVVSALRSLGLMGKGALDKFIPPAYLAASRETRLELLRGLLDTDGWVESFGAIRYATSSPRLAADIQSLVRSLGGVCSCAVKAPRYSHGGEQRDGQPSYVLNIQHPDRASLLTLTRKKRRCVEGARFRAPTVVSVEPDGVEPVQCIAVTHPSRLYVTDDYIVTHNTTLMVNMALGWAKQGYRVGLFSLEMSDDEIATMAIAREASLDRTAIEAGQVEQIDYQTIDQTAARIQALPIYIDDRSGLTVAQIRAACLRLKPDIVMVDHLGMIRAAEPGDVYRGPTERISAISKALKSMAKSLDRPVEVACQLNRAVEGREDKRPQLSDLRQSGEIEEDADVIAFLYRAEYYLRRMDAPDDPDKASKYWAAINNAAGKAEISVAKRRGGPAPAMARLYFDGATAKFTDLEEGRVG